jgi:hypothetical protein
MVFSYCFPGFLHPCCTNVGEIAGIRASSGNKIIVSESNQRAKSRQQPGFCFLIRSFFFMSSPHSKLFTGFISGFAYAPTPQQQPQRQEANK